ncbi:MAG: GNAT family N-acetyltransferase [Proteobacteria bacterium]|nr:GNAT family N-acetyltransferase [Pseudomonadota bacterium]
MFTFLRSDDGQASVDRLDGRVVYLRPPQSSDWRAWAEVRAASRAFLKPWEPTWSEAALTRTTYRHRLRIQARERRDNTGHRFFIFRRDDDSLAGGVNLSNIQHGVAMSCNIGYWIGKSHARRGLMSDAIEALLPFVFDTISLHRLEAACLPSNLASEGLLRKLGFRQEGYARAYLRIDGAWRDHLLFALLASDYRDRGSVSV